MTTTSSPVRCTRDHEMFPGFFRHLVDLGYSTRELCSIVERPDRWSTEFCAFLCSVNVRSPDNGEELRDWLRDVVWASANVRICESAEGPARRWVEVTFCPTNTRGQSENLVADFTDWFGEPINDGDRIPFSASCEGHNLDAVAIAHPETRYGRQIVIFEIEEAR